MLHQFIKQLFNKFNKIAAIVLLINVGITQYIAAQTVVWQDNFDSTGVNSNIWTYDFGDGSQRAAGYGWGNSELQYYTSRQENVRVESETGIFDLSESTTNEMQYEHQSKIQITNYLSGYTHLRFIKVIPKHKIKATNKNNK